MGIILSLILIAVGAILTWGVNTSGGSVNVDVVGVVLMVVPQTKRENEGSDPELALQSGSGRLGRNLEAPPFV
jgi:hypothetical protein